MIKNINPQNIILTPLVTSKEWNLHNIDNTDLVLVDTTSSNDESIALEYLDYFNYNGSGTVSENSDCSIALEQQTGDFVNFQQGYYTSSKFNFENAKLNNDGTPKELVYSQIKNSFYNSLKNPTSLFGMENIDFTLSKTNRYITENFLLFNIPKYIFGEKIAPNTVTLAKLSLDDNMTVKDDGYGNMIVGNNLFFRIQQLRNFKNKILDGFIVTNCNPNESIETWGSIENWNTDIHYWN